MIGPAVASHLNFKLLLALNLGALGALGLCEKGGATRDFGASLSHLPALVEGDPDAAALSVIASGQLWSSTEQTFSRHDPSCSQDRMGKLPACRGPPVLTWSEASFSVQEPHFEGGTEQGAHVGALLGDNSSSSSSAFFL